MTPPEVLQDGYMLSLCPNGCVCIRLGPMALHLSQNDFRSFARKALRLLLTLDHGIMPNHERRKSLEH